jgi:hypothetical protein
MPVHNIQIGDTVVARDGKELGTVKELWDDTHLKVDASMARDYWLPYTKIATCTRGRVEMDFEIDQLDDYKLDEPVSLDSPDPMLDASTTDGLSDSEREGRKQAMKAGYPSVVAEAPDLRE